jgi:lipid II:glycine glycyltransferase (peptidoglycan interpeptide bridge formation enzyme)
MANPGFVKLFLAYQGDKCLAAGLWSFYGNKVTYLHGASDHKSRQLMAPYLLQWEVIKQAKDGGYSYYDFFGIDAQKWPGVTRFKVGFGGRVVNYAGTYDLVFKPVKYYFYNLLRKVRRFL